MFIGLFFMYLFLFFGYMFHSVTPTSIVFKISNYEILCPSHPSHLESYALQPSTILLWFGLGILRSLLSGTLDPVCRQIYCFYLQPVSRIWSPPLDLLCYHPILITIISHLNDWNYFLNSPIHSPFNLYSTLLPLKTAQIMSHLCIAKCK